MNAAVRGRESEEEAGISPGEAEITVTTNPRSTPRVIGHSNIRIP